MAVIDQSAMYRAGLASKSTGRNTAAEEHNRRNKVIADTAFNVLGNITLHASSQAAKHFRNYRNQTNSSMGTITTQINKINPKNTALKAKIKLWKAAHKKAVWRSYNVFSAEKRAAAKDEAAVIMSKLHNLNEGLEGYMANTKVSQFKADAELKINPIEGKNYKLNPGTGDVERKNVAQQADGTMGLLLDADDDGFLTVQRNDIGAGLPDPIRYDKMKFGTFEDPAVEIGIKDTRLKIQKLALSEQGVYWDNQKEDAKKEFYSFINNSNDRQFRDFFFGGFSHEFSSNRNTTTAPAYLYLRNRAMKENSPDKNTKVNFSIVNGENVFESWKDGFGVGSPDWEGEMATLKLMDFDMNNTEQSEPNYESGSRFRQMVAESQWKDLEERFATDRKAWDEENPKPLWIKLGYTNEAAMIKAMGTYKNRTEEFDIVVNDEKIGSKIKTTSDALILKQKDLKALQDKNKDDNQDSIWTGEFVNLPGGIKIGHTPGRGFVEVEDFGGTMGLMAKGDKPTYFKSIKEIFNYYNIPDAYLGETSGADAAELD